LVEESSRLGNQIKSKLFQFGYIKPDDDRVMSPKLLREFGSLDQPVDIKFCIESLGRLYRFVRAEITKLTLRIRKIANEKKNSNIDAIFRFVPGVGPISAAVLSSELGDLSRFKNERQLFSYTGLTPSEFSSGDRERKGRITKQVNTRVRHCLVEVAWRAIQRD
jgi:transposase